MGELVVGRIEQLTSDTGPIDADSLAKIRAHWDSRAALGETAGTQDLILKQLERDAIIAKIPNAKALNILEIGCGHGETANEVAFCRETCRVTAVDTSEAMIAVARQQMWETVENLRFDRGDALNPPKGQFDIVYTQRCLINLPTWELQKQAIDAIADRLVPGGRFLMCEHSQSGLDTINETRARYGLSTITAPWHNRYFRDDEIQSVTTLRLLAWHPFSASYYFMSRVLNAIYAKEHLSEPDYDSPLNTVTVDVRASFAQGRLWVWEKP